MYRIVCVLYCMCIVLYVYCIVSCESEVITWILPVPLDYVLVVVVGGCAEVSAAT